MMKFLIKTEIDPANIGLGADKLFLGTWCLEKSDSSSWKKRSLNMLPYHWDDRVKYKEDYDYLSSVYEEILCQLASDLNILHGLTEDVRYWRIILGPWLRFFIDALFDRYECIRLAREFSADLTCKVQSYDLKDWCTSDFPEFYNLFTSQEWNEIIFSECIKYVGLPFKLDCNSEKLERRHDQKIYESHYSLRSILKRVSSTYSEIVGPHLTGTIVVGSYLPFFKALKFQLKIRKIPYFGSPIIDTGEVCVDEKIRKQLLTGYKEDGFIGFLVELLPTLIPSLYVENFSYVRGEVLRKFPRKPQIIFTANSYHGDEAFKIWAAEKTSEDVPLLIGQHGGLFGAGALNQSQDHQIKISDKFISWGWSGRSKNKISNLPSLQLSGRSPIKRKPRGKVLHVLSGTPRYFFQHFSMPVAGQFLSYMEDQKTFLDDINGLILENIVIRFDRSLSERNFDMQALISEFGYSENVDQCDNSFLRALQESSICICTYNATSLLETLSLNFPTIIFWDPKFYELNISAEPFYEKLVDAGILFYSPKDAAEKLNDIYDDIDAWWFSDQVQTARQVFCDRYAKTSSDCLANWSNFFKET